MMVPDLDIWRAAVILVERHGVDHAAMVAAQTGDEMRAKGDEEGYRIWAAILEAVLQLRRDKPGEGESVN